MIQPIKPCSFMEKYYDIFISYKRKSLPTANNLYYRLTTRGYSVFFDLEEMGRDNFNTQLLRYIENAKDVFVILEDGSLDACKSSDWEKDWFCNEISYALEKEKNIIPILLDGYQMPDKDFLPEKLKSLSYKNAPEFSFTFFEAYLDKLIEKEYLISEPNIQEKTSSVLVKNPSKPISLKLSIAELLGNEYYAHVDFAGKDVIAKVNAELNIENGQQLELVLNLDKYSLFDKVNGANIKPYKE